MASRSNQSAGAGPTKAGHRHGRGRYFGRPLVHRQLGDLVLTETEYQAGTRLPGHAHEHPYFCLVMSGSYDESVGRGRAWELGPGSLLYHPSGSEHADHFRADETRCFIVDLSGAWVRRLCEGPVDLRDPALLRGGPLPALASRLRLELRNEDELSALVAEGLALTLIGRLARQKKGDGARAKGPPAWLERGRELLHARFRERLGTEAIAAELGVHPVHLSRTFRHHCGCTVGEYLRTLRVDYARGRLEQPGVPLAEIAHEAGFADQSHFARTFRRLTGVSPAAYRAEHVTPARGPSRAGVAARLRAFQAG